MARLKPRTLALLLTCEHASYRLPRRYGRLGLTARLARSHVAWDPGARNVARDVARALDCSYFEGRYSRLLVDLNRSETHPRLIPRVAFSVAVPGNTGIDTAELRRRIERYWRPHRTAVERWLRARTARGRECLHVGIHSFVPVLSGEVRRCDVGLLFDPRHRLESAVARVLRKSLRSSQLTVRFNYPYRGTSDGLTTAMRSRLPASLYAGIEIELNQAILATALSRAHVGSAVREALRSALEAHLT